MNVDIDVNYIQLGIKRQMEGSLEVKTQVLKRKLIASQK